MISVVAAPARDGFIGVGETAPNFTLQDQFDKEFSLKALAGSIVVIFNAGREKSPASAEFGKRLDEKYNTRKESAGKNRIEIIPVGDLRGVPGVLKSTVKNFIRNKQTDGKPDTTPLLLDWKGVIAEKYGCNKSEVNVYVIGADGKIAFAGVVATKDDEAKVIAALDALLSKKK